MRAALTTAQGCLLRAGEMTVESQSRKDIFSSLKLDSLRFLPSKVNAKVMKIKLHGSKTNQFATPESVAVHCKCKNGNPCAVHEVLNMLNFRRVKSLREPVFWMASGNIVSRKMISTVIKNCCVAEKLNPNEYSPHSLRRGGATDSAESGVSEWMIRKLGRWSDLSRVNRTYQLLSPEKIVTIINNR